MIVPEKMDMAGRWNVQEEMAFFLPPAERVRATAAHVKREEMRALSSQRVRCGLDSCDSFTVGNLRRSSPDSTIKQIVIYIVSRHTLNPLHHSLHCFHAHSTETVF
ncbi:hypothetical protein ABFV05_011049 [Capra hircus]